MNQRRLHAVLSSWPVQVAGGYDGAAGRVARRTAVGVAPSAIFHRGAENQALAEQVQGIRHSTQGCDQADQHRLFDRGVL